MIGRNTYRYRIKGHPILKRDEYPICLLYHVKIGHDMPLRIPDKSGAAALRHIRGLRGRTTLPAGHW